MFSFVGDTVLDPFPGTATTNITAALWGRNSIGYEIDETYLAFAAQRFQKKETAGLFNESSLKVRRFELG